MGAVEAVALAMLNGKRAREGWPPRDQIEPGFIDGDEWRLEAADAIAAARPFIAAECAKVARAAFDDRPRTRDSYHYQDGYDDGTKAAETAIKETIR